MHMSIMHVRLHQPRAVSVQVSTQPKQLTRHHSMCRTVGALDAFGY